MKRTVIITIETSGDDAYRVMDAAVDDLLTNCDDISNRYRECSVNAEIANEFLSETLIAKLCNTRPT